MLASLSISMWGARRHDKQISKEVADQHQTTETAGRYTKNLLPDEGAEVYKAIVTAAGACRAEFYKETLPWLDSGSRILPATNFLHFSEVMKEKEAALKATWQPFFEQYPFLRARAKNTRGSMFNEADYPDAYELRERFDVELKFLPIPDAADFRVDIADDAVAAIKEQISKDQKSTVAKAMEEPYKELFDAVAHMGARLAGAKTCPCRGCKGKTFLTDQFGDSIVNNMVEICQRLPRLNLTADPYLNAFIEQTKASLTGFQPDTIRASDQVRKTLAERAAEIAADMGGYMKLAS